MKDSDSRHGDTETLIRQIRDGFARTARPPDAFLVGSNEGCEPEEEVGPFRGRDWQSLDPEFLDAHYCALSFFSEGGFRYFLPAFLIADVEGRLRTADPVFALTHGLHDWSTPVEADGRQWERRYGTSVVSNPKRYGAMTYGDYARYRLSVFTREEAKAIVAYLRYAAARDDIGITAEAVESALERYWLDRAENAPTADELEARVAEEDAFSQAILNNTDKHG
jgi:hypothetical protein